MKPGFYSDYNNQYGGKSELPFKVVFGSSGAVASTPLSRGITSVVHGATGVYTITLNEKAVRLFSWDLPIKQATYSASGACQAQVTAEDVNGAKTITILTTNAAGAAVEPTTGDALYGCLNLQWVDPSAHGTG